MEPTPRWYLEPWAIGPVCWFHLRMTPVKPWPLETPVTSTFSPASKMSAVRTWPTS